MTYYFLCSTEQLNSPGVHFLYFSSSDLALYFQTACLTLALSKLRIWPWKAAGLLRAAIRNRICGQIMWTRLKKIEIISVISVNQHPSLLSYPCLLHISFSVSDGRPAVLILTWHDALVHQLLPGSPLLKPQLQDWKQKRAKNVRKDKNRMIVMLSRKTRGKAGRRGNKQK